MKVEVRRIYDCEIPKELIDEYKIEYAENYCRSCSDTYAEKQLIEDAIISDENNILEMLTETIIIDDKVYKEWFI